LLFLIVSSQRLYNACPCSSFLFVLQGQMPARQAGAEPRWRPRLRADLGEDGRSGIEPYGEVK